MRSGDVQMYETMFQGEGSQDANRESWEMMVNEIQDTTFLPLFPRTKNYENEIGTHRDVLIPKLLVW